MENHYLHSAAAAARVLEPHRETVTLPAPADGAAPRAFADDRTASAWFAAEYQVLHGLVALTGG